MLDMQIPQLFGMIRKATTHAFKQEKRESLGLIL